MRSKCAARRFHEAFMWWRMVADAWQGERPSIMQRANNGACIVSARPLNALHPLNQKRHSITINAIHSPLGPALAASLARRTQLHADLFFA